MIEIINLKKKYGSEFVINNISLRIKKKEIIGLVGENGSGKSTLLRLLSGVIMPTHGLIICNGRKLCDHTLLIQKKIGFLSQKNPLYQNMTVYEFLNFVACMHKIKKEAIRWKIKKVIKNCDLKAIISKKISYLAKGYQQRIGIAQALIHDPDLLLLDDPSAGLDIQNMNAMKSIISQIGKRRTVILSTHRIHEFENICTRVISLKNGSLYSDMHIKSKITNYKLSLIHTYLQLDKKINLINELKDNKEIASIEKQFNDNEKNIYHISSHLDIRNWIWNLCKKNDWQIHQLAVMDSQNMKFQF